jgi:hypothetical protein
VTGNVGPAFIIIGAGRAGTTWLRTALARHPNIFVLPGEPQFFNRRHGEIDKYLHTLVSGRHKSKVSERDYSVTPKLYGEKSPGYIFMPEQRIQIVAEHFPDVRLICLTREPVARARSHYAHLKRSGLNPTERMDVIVNSSRYLWCLTRWRKFFSVDQILILDFERIAAEPREVYRDALDHIGARWHEPPDVAMQRDERAAPSASQPFDATIEDRLRVEPYRAAELRALLRDSPNL